MDGANAVSVVTSSSYRIELAIPWTAIGLTSVPAEQSISVNLETLSGDGTAQLVEGISDASNTKPATWVPLHLIGSDPTGMSSPIENMQEGAAYNLAGQQVAQGYQGIIIKDGKKTLRR